MYELLGQVTGSKRQIYRYFIPLQKTEVNLALNDYNLTTKVPFVT